MTLRLGLVWLSLVAFAQFAPAAPEDIVKIGDAAPAFVGQTSDGGSVDLAALKGRVVLLNFFATWCPPCKAEMPVLEAEVWAPLHEKGLEVFAIGRQHSVEEVAAFKAANRLSFRFVADPDRAIFAKYATGYIPRCYLIGKDGTVKAATIGYEPEEFAQLVAAIRAELAR
ncbi:MAG TPA: TlpA disulfide reductase family protein [Opitutaceae bacterium]|nr:TlpA disulfide reductase family protein [Opitutaceae bacterium]